MKNTKKSLLLKGLALSTLALTLASCINPIGLEPTQGSGTPATGGTVAIPNNTASAATLNDREKAYLAKLEGSQWSDQQLIKDYNGFNNPYVKNAIILRLVDVLVKQNKYSAAEYYLNSFTPSQDPNQQNNFNLYAVKVGNLTNNPDLIARGQNLDPTKVSVDKQLTATEEAFNLDLRNGDYDQALNKVNTAYPSLSVVDRSKLVNFVLQSLTSRLNDNRLNALAENAANNDQVLNTGWYRLAQMAYMHRNDDQMLASSWATWNGTFAQYKHPASLSQPDLFKQSVKTSKVTFNQISVLLPLSDNGYGNYAKAIQAGIEQANKNSGSKARIAYFDTGTGSLEDNYVKAAQSGNIIIGPLTKGNVDLLADVQLQVPEIMLNENGKHNPLACYATLRIEDEAEVAAQYLVAKRIRNPIILSDGKTSSQRAATIFAGTWEERKQQHVNTITYTPSNLNQQVHMITRMHPRPGAIYFQGDSSALVSFQNSLSYYIPEHNIITVAGSKSNDATLSTGKLKDFENVYILDSDLIGSPNRPASRTAREILSTSNYNFFRLYGLGYDSFEMAQKYSALRNVANFQVSGINATYRAEQDKNRCLIKAIPSLYKVENGNFIKTN